MQQKLPISGFFLSSLLLITLQFGQNTIEGGNGKRYKRKKDISAIRRTELKLDRLSFVAKTDYSSKGIQNNFWLKSIY